MKDYLLMLMAFGGFFIVFFIVEFCEKTTLSQVFLGIGTMMMWLPIPIDLMLDMHEEEKKRKKEEK